MRQDDLSDWQAQQRTEDRPLGLKTNATGDAFEGTASEHFLLVEAGPRLQTQLDQISGNRWAAFTGDELQLVEDGLQALVERVVPRSGGKMAIYRLSNDLRADLERRRA